LTPRENVRVTIWKLSLQNKKVKRVWQGDFSDSLHQLSLSPDRRFLILTELGLYFEEKELIFQKKLFVRIRSISLAEIDNSYTLVINPFGENYPEKDTVLHSSFNDLRSYMEEGGFLLSIGAAFYYHQNPLITFLCLGKSKTIFIL
jgi:hypothetical protein